MKPTREQIDQEIVTLQSQLLTVRPFSAFGDDHIKVMKAQIFVAEENMDEDGIYNLYGEYDEDDGGDSPDVVNYEEITSIMDMRRWLDGDEGAEAPSEGWAGLCSTS